MNTAEQINSAVNNLAEKLGVAVENLYPVLIKQVHIEGIFTLVFAIISLLSIFISVKLWIYGNKENDDNTKMIGAGLSAIFLMLLLFLSYHVITCFVNPEYRAIEMILNNIK